MVGFVDRVAELAALRKLVAGKGAALARVYGRRRLGKTELLHRLLEEGSGLYYAIPEHTLPGILLHLSEETQRQTGRPVKYDSLRAFYEDLPNHGRRFVVLDEFQRLRLADPAAESHLQDIWDTRLQDQHLVIVLCGSAIGMMRRLNDATAPLHRRFRFDLLLAPMPYAGIREFYPGASEEERIARYGVFGATPHYHRITRTESLPDAIRSAFLDPGAPLREEPRLLMETELRSTQRYLEVFEAIGTGARTLGEVASRYNQPSAAYSPYVATLRSDLGFLQADDPLGGKKRKGRLRFTDPFFQFYYAHVYPRLGRLELGDSDDVAREIQARLPTHLGRVFEDVARQALLMINGRQWEATRFRFDQLGAWWDDGDELEVVAIGPDACYAGEAKFTRKKADQGDVRTLLRRATRLAQIVHKTSVPLLFTKSGATSAANRMLEGAGGHVFDLDDLARIFAVHDPKPGQ